MNDAPLGLFITRTVYGTFLPGDNRGWYRIKGQQTSRPDWKHGVVRNLSTIFACSMIPSGNSDQAMYEICAFRTWTLWAVSARTNHVHAVVSAPNIVRR